MPAIEVNKLKKYYGRICGCENSTLHVDYGEILGFVGPNGSGKSTTIKALLGIIYKDSGTAQILGKDVLDDANLLYNVGYASSDSTFYKSMRVRDILKFTADVYGKKLDRGLEFAKKLDLDVDKKVNQLSLGNKKKTSIVNAMLSEPKILILDEPTNGLDPHVQIEFFKLIAEFKSNKAAILLSTHIMSDVQRYCDRVSIIKSGVVERTDSITQLLKTEHKRVRIVLDKTPNLEGLSDTSKLFVKGNTVEGEYSGDINALVYHIVKFGIKDISITDSGLDAVVEQYYKKD